jgi:hypothetical protein
MGEGASLSAMRRLADDCTMSLSEAAQRLDVERGDLERAAAAYEVPTVVLRGVYRLPLTWVEQAKASGWTPSRRTAARTARG